MPPNSSRSNPPFAADFSAPNKEDGRQVVRTPSVSTGFLLLRLTSSKSSDPKDNEMADAPELAKFKTLFLAYAKAMLEVTNAKFVDNGAERVLLQEYQFSGNEYELSSRYSPALVRFLPWRDDDAFPHDVAKKCADAFFSAGLASGIRLSDNAGTRIENPSLEQLRPFITHMHIDRPIRHLVRKHERTSFRRAQILACLDQYIAHWNGKADSEPEIAPIYNLQTNVQSIKLDGWVSIVGFSDEEKTRRMRMLGNLDRTIDIRNYASALQAVRVRPVAVGFEEDARREVRTHARQALQCAVTSLRLMKPEGVGTMGYIRLKGPEGQLGGGISPLEDFHLPWNRVRLFRKPYVLDRADLQRFRMLYGRLSQERFKTWDTLELLLRQFNRACQKERAEDRILDYAICCEAALLSGVNHELSYRLALRAAKLLRDRCSPRQTFEHMRCLYEVRSTIVHSGETVSSPKTRREIRRAGLEEREFMPAVDTLMRELLSAIIERIADNHSLGEICKNLDVEIIEAL